MIKCNYSIIRVEGWLLNMVDENYITQLENRIEEYETMLFMSNNELKDSSNFTAMDATEIFEETKTLIKNLH